MNPDDFKAIEGQHLHGQAFEFSARTLVNGAQDSSFTDCEIILDPKKMPAFRGGARHWFARVLFTRCTIRALGKVRDPGLANQVSLLQCRLEGGPFIESTFGLSPYLAKTEEDASRLVVDCDFTSADLRDARFYQTPIGNIRLPRWPYITVVARDGEDVYAPPSATRPALTTLLDEVAAAQWEDRAMALAMDSLVFGVGTRPNEASVQVCHAEDVVKRGARTTEYLRAELDRFAHPAIRY